MAEKEFKTHPELIELLQSRDVVIDTPSRRRKAMLILKREGYYGVINGYKKLFLLPGGDEKYKPGTTLDEIYAIYCFDRAIRNIFLRSLLQVETTIKNQISYIFSEKYGHDNYLLYKNFDTTVKDANIKISKLFSSIQGEIANRSMDPNISHYLKNHGYIPMWVLSKILTFGNMSKFYSLMKQPERQDVSRQYKISDSNMIIFLSYLTSIRNFCAHGNRLYCFSYANKPLPNLAIHGNLSIPLKGSEYVQGKKDLFAAVIILRYLLLNRDFKFFYSELNGAINKLSSKLKTISIDDVLSEMGFPSNWKDIKKSSIK